MHSHRSDEHQIHQGHSDLNAFFGQQPNPNQHNDISTSMGSAHTPTYPFTPHQPFNDAVGVNNIDPSSMGLDVDFMSSLNSMLSMQGGLDNAQTSPIVQSSNLDGQALMDQQYKVSQLQHLHALQSQILQQQLRLLSGQNGGALPDQLANSPMGSMSSSSVSPADILPTSTPSFASSTAMQHHHQYLDSRMQHHTYQHHQPPPDSPYLPTPTMSAYNMNSTSYIPDRGCTSAPAHIAFAAQTEMDFDVSPLTSPWLGAEGSVMVPSSSSSSQRHDPTHHARRRGMSTSVTAGSKRPASPTTSESRKRQSPAIGPTHPESIFAMTPLAKPVRTTRSTNSTPLLRSTSSRRRTSVSSPRHRMTPHKVGSGSGMDMMLNDSPSPVDLSMPPPAQPASASPSALDEDVGMPMLPPTNVNVNGSGSGGGNSHLVPVTPASIMGIGKSVMQSRTAAGAGAGNGNENRAGDDTAASRTRQQRTNVFKAAAIPTSPAPVVPDAPSTSTRSKAPKRKATTDPQSTPTTSAVPSTSSSSGAAEPAPSGPVEAVRKTTHKDAEQKRRDSMKNKFDELRSLLPIIPLPSDENYPHSSSSSSKPALLPGALPPRGPPKAGQEGPNKAVSRLQLLVCGNEFIRDRKSVV